ncbi:MAG: flagellar basal-body MS-ring/collar protein FliF [Alphaproteobacteria bacterium]
MGGLIETIRNIGMPRLTAIIAGTATMLGLLIFLIANGTKSEMALLYSDLDPQATNQIADQLASRQIEYSMSNDQSRISVPRDQVSQLRLEFAEQGLSGAIVGYDLFDRDESLGQSSFTQEVNRLRALEGELSRTIASIDNVRGARVHIVMPRRELFSRDPQEATASIILRMQGAHRLDRSQTGAIQQLVATAVPQLSPQRITIIDDRGTLLHGGGDAEDGTLTPDSIADMRSSFEGRMSGRITEMLERVVGIGKARVEISAEMDFSQEVQNIQSYDPEQQVVVSSRETQENEQSTEGAQDTVTVGNNLPDAGGLDGGVSGDSEQRSRIDAITNFQTGNTRTERIVPPGRVERLSVAVVVDGIRLEDGTYQSRTEEEMEVLRELVESAVGIDRARGDQVTIHNLRFEEVPVFDSLDEEDLFGIPVAELRSVGQTGIIALVVLLIALLIVRPLITRLFDMQQQAAAARAQADQPTMLTDQSGAPYGAEGTDMVPAGEQDEFESMIDIAHIEGRVKASSLKKIGEIVEKHPEEAVSILRTWMYQESN